MGNDISGRWSGIYYYPQNSNINISSVPFEAMLQQFGNTLGGRITEENTFAPLGGSVLEAKISGYIVGGIVSFSKTYNSGVNASHTVDYHGYLTGKGKTISGHWQIEDWTGTFTMHRKTENKQPIKKAVIKQAANA